MAREEVLTAAERYLQDQAEVMGKFGKKPKLSGPHYQKVFNDVVKIFSNLYVEPNAKASSKANRGSLTVRFKSKDRTAKRRTTSKTSKSRAKA
jgi:hypothetical protein